MSYKDFIRMKTSKNDYVEDKPVDDWQINKTVEMVKPEYSNDGKDYNVSMRDIISGINSSKYKVSGANVWLPDKYGNLVTLPDWVNKYQDENKHYRIEIISTQGNIIKDKHFSTTLKAIVYENNKDVTEIKNKKYFKWARYSGNTERDQIADAEWNLKWADGAKEIPITNEDVNRNAMFQVQFVTEKEARIWEREAYNAYINKINNLR